MYVERDTHTHTYAEKERKRNKVCTDKIEKMKEMKSIEKKIAQNKTTNAAKAAVIITTTTTTAAAVTAKNRVSCFALPIFSILCYCCYYFKTSSHFVFCLFGCQLCCCFLCVCMYVLAFVVIVS